MRQAGLLMVALISLGSVLAPSDAPAETCVTFESDTKAVSFNVIGERMFRGVGPIRFCDAVPDKKYGIVIEGRGYETRSFKFTLKADNSIDVSGNRLNYVSRSAVLPGWGQWKLGHTDAGGWAFTLTAGSLVYLGYAAYEYVSAKDELDTIESNLMNATSVSEIEQYGDLRSAQSLAVDTQQQHLIEVGVFAGYIYVNNLVETWLWATPPKTTVDGNTVRISTPEKSNTRATFRSLFFPGLGQKYIGSATKGYLFQTAFLAAGVGVIESRLDYREAQDSYALWIAELEDAENADDIEDIRQGAEEAWDNVLRKERHRNAWYIAAGSIWLLNVLDAMFSNTLENEAPGFFETSLSGKTIRTGVNVRF